MRPAGALLGSRNTVDKFTRFLIRRLDLSKTYRIGIGHALRNQDANTLHELLCGAVPNVDYSFVTEVGPALGTHAGPGGLVVGFQEYERPVNRPS